MSNIQPVQENHSCLGHGIKSAALGGVIGYASKYALPLTVQEKDAEYRNIIEMIKKNAVKSKFDFTEKVKGFSEKSLSNDAYISSTKKFVKNNIRTYDRALKSLRPTGPFVIVGAVTGLVASFIHNTLDI